MAEQEPDKLALARHWLEVQRPEQALEALAQAGDALNTLPFWHLRSQALFYLERYREAVEMAHKGLALEPEDPFLLFLLAASEEGQGHLAEAERALLTALRVEPENPALLSRYAQVVALGGQWDKAERLLAEAARVAPDAEIVARTRIVVAYLRADNRETEARSRALLSLDPENVTGHYFVGYSLANKGSHAAAARHLETAARSNPDEAAFTDLARQNRYLSHWLLWPLRPLRRFGIIPVWFTCIAIIFALLRWGPPPCAAAFILAYLAFAVYSWVAPPLLRWWLGRL